MSNQDKAIEITEKYMAALATSNSHRIYAAVTEALEYRSKELDKYYELLYAVESKFPNETRHETALRYIRNAEGGKDDQQAKMEKPA